MTKTHVVTGATGYTGRYIARRLLRMGHGIRSLTGHPDRSDPFEGQVRMMPYHFDNPDLLARSLVGADTLFNTYWIRMAYADITHERAAENLKILFAAAQWAGVRRVVHISIANATYDCSPPLLQGQGDSGTVPPRVWAVLRYHQADTHLRTRGHTAEQHSLGAASFPSLSYPRTR